MESHYSVIRAVYLDNRPVRAATRGETEFEHFMCPLSSPPGAQYTHSALEDPEAQGKPATDVSF